MFRGELIAGERLAARDEDAWRSLAEERGNPFVTPEWHAAMRGGERMMAVARDRESALRGVLPVSRERWRGLEVLRYPGAALGDRFHLAAAEADEPEAARAAIGALASAPAGRRLVLEKSSTDSGWLDAGSDLLPGRAAVKRDELPWISLAGLDWDGYLASRSKNVRQRLGRMERKLTREYGLEARATTEESTLESDFATLFRLHDARRDEVGGSSLGSEAARRQLLEFCRASLRRGWLRLRLLSCDSEPVAAFLGWSIGGRYSYYQGGFDPSWAGRSVGLVSLGLAIRDAIEEGAREFDLLLGPEDYKRRLATGTRHVDSVVLASRASPVYAMARAERLARHGRAWVRRSGSRDGEGAAGTSRTSAGGGAGAEHASTGEGAAQASGGAE